MRTERRNSHSKMMLPKQQEAVRTPDGQSVVRADCVFLLRIYLTFAKVTRHELLQLLTQSRSFRHLFTTVRRGTDTAGDEDDDEEVTNGPVRTRRRRRRSDLYPKVPSEAGRELMDSGEFGLNERDLGQYDRKKRLATSIMRRELGLEPPGKQRSANRIASQVCGYVRVIIRAF